MAEDQARWMANLLATSIQVSGLSEEELERRLGWSAGSVARLLEGEADLDPDHVLTILSELSGDSRQAGGAGFEEPEAGRTQLVTDLMERFHRLSYEQVAIPEEDMDISELERKVEAILRGAFGTSNGRRED